MRAQEDNFDGREFAIMFPRGHGRTKQEFKAECDINEIMRRFGKTKELPVGTRAPTFGDFSQVMDFQSAMNAIAGARESFDTLPAVVRKRFNNDPQEFVVFCSDEANKAELQKLGLVVPQVVQAASDLAAGGSTTPAAPAAAAASSPVVT